MYLCSNVGVISRKEDVLSIFPPVNGGQGKGGDLTDENSIAPLQDVAIPWAHGDNWLWETSKKKKRIEMIKPTMLVSLKTVLRQFIYFLLYYS